MRALTPHKSQSITAETANTRDPLAEIRQKTETHFLSAPGSHDWEHTLRVHRLCQKIGRKEGADMTTLEAAALLHDIGRSAQDQSNGSICHAEKGAAMAADLLAGLGFDDARI